MLIIKIPEWDFHFELHCWALLWRWLLTFPVQTVFLLPDTKTQHKCCKYDKSSVSRTLLSLYIHKFIYLYTNIYISYVLFISDVTFTHLSPETFNFKHWKYVYIFCSSVPVNPPPPKHLRVPPGCLVWWKYYTFIYFLSMTGTLLWHQLCWAL